jgi:tetraacyldisaccharide 4'-kinase
MRTRNFCYDHHIFKIENIDVPVISVGNISAGGTGKTPFVEYIVNFFLQKKKTVAVLSRGYKRTTKGTYLVSDGSEIFGDVRKSGDEPFQIAIKFPQCIVVVDEQRVRGAQFIRDNFMVDAIILDDGFQHRSIGRAMDIVILDSLQQEQRLLPIGTNRESFSGLRRSSFIIFSRCENNAHFSDFALRMKKYSSAPVAMTQFLPVKLINLLNGDEVNINEIRDANIFAFCGIGSPESFRQILQHCDGRVNEFIVYEDHHAYSPKELEIVQKKFIGSKDNFCITTEKDAMRIQEIFTKQLVEKFPVYMMKIQAHFLTGEKEFQTQLLQSIEERNTVRTKQGA